MPKLQLHLELKNESTLSCALILSSTLFLTYAPSLSLSLLDQGVKCISCKRLVVIGWEWTGRVDENTNQLRQKMTDSSNKRRRMKPICNKIKNKKISMKKFLTKYWKELKWVIITCSSFPAIAFGGKIKHDFVRKINFYKWCSISRIIPNNILSDYWICLPILTYVFD